MDKRNSVMDRRNQTFRSVVYGALYPRRRTNRRLVDDQFFIVDWHDQGLFMVAMAIVTMSCLDALFTLNLLSMGAEEVNYFMKVLIETDVNTFVLIKLLATCSGVLLLVTFARFRLAGVLKVRRVLEVLCAIYGCLIVWELYLLTGFATGKFI